MKTTYGKQQSTGRGVYPLYDGWFNLETRARCFQQVPWPSKVRETWVRLVFQEDPILI